MEIVIEKMCHLKTTAALVIVGAMVIINKHIDKIFDYPSLYEIQKIEEYYQYD